jgi:hypothetical protein
MAIQKMLRSIAAAAAVAAAGSASAAVVTLDFEGIPNQTAVGNFYQAQYGVTFSPATLALVDSDAGGTGNFANEPSPNTIMFFLDANNAILNVAAGFDKGFSFFYTSSTAAAVTVWSELNGTGTLLATIDLMAQANGNGCGGDPTGGFCNFTAAGAQFGGIAKSINFGGTANFTGYDNITFGSSTPGSGPQGVPEPMSLALVGTALLGLAASRRRKA